ncbi:MAG: peptide-methionine (S)-S-oxide reductase MsrA, partial [Gammaproteobacteria bacterium]
MKFLSTLFVSAMMAVLLAADGFAENNSGQPEPLHSKNLSVATFAGGCFWCTEADFEKLPGVAKVISGYSGGKSVNPTYEQVSKGGTGHVESVQVYFDPRIINYDNLLDAFWRMVDPTDNEGQFVDRGNQYRTLIFYHDPEQKAKAEHSRQRLIDSKRYPAPVMTEIRKFEVFYKAEDYHQDYYKKNPVRYKFYRFNSGR